MFGTDPVTAGSTAHRASMLIDRSPALLKSVADLEDHSLLASGSYYACVRTRTRHGVVDGAGAWTCGLARVRTVIAVAR
jgi:hypothetical protein